MDNYIKLAQAIIKEASQQIAYGRMQKAAEKPLKQETPFRGWSIPQEVADNNMRSQYTTKSYYDFGMNLPANDRANWMANGARLWPEEAARFRNYNAPQNQGEPSSVATGFRDASRAAREQGIEYVKWPGWLKRLWTPKKQPSQEDQQ